jgi:N utilization substance protein B
MLGFIVRGAEDLDATFIGLLDRPQEQLDQVERAILRLATAEFSHRIDIPYRVVIDEYIELAKTFGAQDSYKYINGVLDKLAKELRSIEVEAINRG